MLVFGVEVPVPLSIRRDTSKIFQDFTLGEWLAFNHPG